MVTVQEHRLGPTQNIYIKHKCQAYLFFAYNLPTKSYYSIECICMSHTEISKPAANRKVQYRLNIRLIEQLV